jgi:hypothetical protein
LKTISRTVLLFGLLITSLVCRAETAAPDPAAPVDQVVVKATREKLAKLEKEVKLAEQRFYDRYNQVNTKRDYAVKCYNEADTGTRFKKTYCQPVFTTKAQEEQARRTVAALGSSATPATSSSAAASMHAGATVGVAGMAGGASSGEASESSAGAATGVTGAPALMAVAGSQGDFQKNMLEATRKSPELMKLLNEYAEKMKEYEALQRQINGLAAKE